MVVGRLYDDHPGRYISAAQCYIKRTARHTRAYLPFDALTCLMAAFIAPEVAAAHCWCRSLVELDFVAGQCIAMVHGPAAQIDLAGIDGIEFIDLWRRERLGSVYICHCGDSNGGSGEEVLYAKSKGFFCVVA
jgi:hypothetical protein